MVACESVGTMSRTARPVEAIPRRLRGRPGERHRLADSRASATACHLERVSPRTSRKVPTGLGARISQRTASLNRGTFRLRGLGGRSAQGDMLGGGLGVDVRSAISIAIAAPDAVSVTVTVSVSASDAVTVSVPASAADTVPGLPDSGAGRHLVVGGEQIGRSVDGGSQEHPA